MNEETIKNPIENYLSETTSSGIDNSPESVGEISRKQHGKRPGKFAVASHTLVVSTGERLIQYLIIKQAKFASEIIAFGSINPQDILIETSDPFQLQKGGIEWLLSNSGVEIDNIRIVSTNLDFYVRKLEVPKLKRKELLNAVAWEVDKLVPIPVESSYLKIKTDDSGDKQVTVTIGAVPRPQIDQWIEFGHKLKKVVPTSVALSAAGPRAKDSKAAYCYIYYTNTYLNIGFYNSDGLQYSHPVQFQSNRLFDTGETGITEKRVVEDLIGSVEVFYSYFPDITIQGLIIMADPEKTRTLKETILERMEFEVIPVEFCRGISFPANSGCKELPVEYVPLLGALRASKDDFVFLPHSIEELLKHRKIKRYAHYATLTSLLAGVIIAGSWYLEIRGISSELAGKQAVESRLLTSEAYKTISAYRENTEFMKSLDQQFKANDTRYSRLLKTLSTVTPSGIYLEGITTSNKDADLRLSITGYYDGVLDEADIALMSFMESLKARHVENLRLQRLGKKLSGGRKIESFQLDGVWR